MTVVMVIWLAALSALLYAVYRIAEQGRGLRWQVEELRRELDITKRNLEDARKKLERATSPA